MKETPCLPSTSGSLGDQLLFCRTTLVANAARQHTSSPLQPVTTGALAHAPLPGTALHPCQPNHPNANNTPTKLPPALTGDQALADRIHLALVAERALSQKAQNIKIFTLDSFVTLNGTVNSGEEKRMVGEIAMSIAGQDKVDNQLYVR